MSSVIRNVLAGLSRATDSHDPELRQRDAAGALALMVGGIVLARALDDSNDADRFLERVREFAHEALQS
jgi:hypothetical protein